jgi:hypothetical protein
MIAGLARRPPTAAAQATEQARAHGHPLSQRDASTAEAFRVHRVGVHSVRQTVRLFDWMGRDSLARPPLRKAVLHVDQHAAVARNGAGPDPVFVEGRATALVATAVAAGVLVGQTVTAAGVAAGPVSAGTAQRRFGRIDQGRGLVARRRSPLAQCHPRPRAHHVSIVRAASAHRGHAPRALDGRLLCGMARGAAVRQEYPSAASHRPGSGRRAASVRRAGHRTAAATDPSRRSRTAIIVVSAAACARTHDE